MIVKFGAIRYDHDVLIDVDGDVIYIDGEVFDFSPLKEGSILPSGAISSIWFTGNVTRIDGVIHLTINIPHGAYAPEDRRFPTVVFEGDGDVNSILPEYDIPPEEPEYGEVVEEKPEEEVTYEH